jgi:nucleotide-binding universal stress UspA family protein
LPMEIKKLLYITHRREPAYEFIEGLTEMGKIGLKEIILFPKNPPKELTDRFSDHGIHLKGVDGSGPLIPRIFEVADKEHVSLIIAHGHGDKEGSIRGRTARRLIRNTPVPLLIIQENGNQVSPSTRGLFNSVILATDWSDAAGRAWLYIIGIKEIVGVVDIVYVMHEKPTIGEIRQLKERVEEVRKICLAEDMDAEYHIYAGKTADEIVLASRDYNGTVIAMGYKPKGPLKEIFSGSSCYGVVEKSSVPVLIIP